MKSSVRTFLFPLVKKPPEAVIILQEAKRSFHLDRTAYPQENAFLCGDVRLGDRALLLVMLPYPDLLQLVTSSGVIPSMS